MTARAGRVVAALVAIGALAVALAACGGGASSTASPTPDVSANAPAAQAGDIAVYAPSLPAPPTNDVAALYFTVKNTGADADRLMSVSTDVAQSAAVHETVTQGNSSVMQPVTGGLPVPAHGEATLAPGGYHVMLMQLKRTLQPGDSVRVTLRFQHAGELSFTAPVTTYGAMAGPTGTATTSMPMPMGTATATAAAR